MPKGYSKESPRLSNGPSAGLPRVYDIALEHNLSRRWPRRSGKPQQFRGGLPDRHCPEIGRIVGNPDHAAPGADRESATHRGTGSAADRIDRNRADYWADQMTEIAEKHPKNLILAIADMARSNPPICSSFVAELARRLQGQSPALALPLTWIEQRLSESGLTIEQTGAVGEPTTGRRSGLHRQQHRQPAFPGDDGLARVRRNDERCRADLAHRPGGAYDKMDFATRDRYRHVVEKIAQKQPPVRGEIACKAIQLAIDGGYPERQRRSGSACRVLPDRQGIAGTRTNSGSTSIDPEGLRGSSGGSLYPAIEAPSR